MRRLEGVASACEFTRESVHLYGTSKDQHAADIHAALGEVDRLRKVLLQIASADYRGNRDTCAMLAHNALQ